VGSAAVYTTVFPNALPFLAEFGDSLRQQTDQDFDLCVGLDRVSRGRAVAALGRPVVHWVSSRAGDSPARLRAEAFAWLCDRYDEVVLVDSDDVLTPDRVAAARAGLRSADVYGCALELVDAAGESLGFQLRPPTGRDWSKFLTAGNVFGLSNTAYRSHVLKQVGDVSAATGIVDWYLVTSALAAGHNLVFDDEVRMHYRQYGASTLESFPPYSVEGTRRALALAQAHYEAVLPIVRDRAIGFGQALSRQLERLSAFEAFTRTDAVSDYVARLNRAVVEDKTCWWWRQVAAPEWESLWM
jgi:hypothetical protein